MRTAEWRTRAEKLKVYKKAHITLTKSEESLIDAYDEFEAANFWNWVYPEGATAEEVQDELMDYRTFMEEGKEVYMHITRGTISKINTHAFEVIGVADEKADEDAKEYAQEVTHDLRQALETIKALPSDAKIEDAIDLAEIALEETE